MRYVFKLFMFVSVVTLIGCKSESSSRPPQPEPEFAFQSPLSVIKVTNSNWQEAIKLPDSPEGFVVEIISDASKAINVLLADADVMSDASIETIMSDERASFVKSSTGWERETITIDLLLLYSDKLDENEAKKSLLEGLEITNDTLYHSKAEFRFRMVGLESVTPEEHWESLNDALSELRSYLPVQKLRYDLKADAVYYQGTESGCGLAYVRASSFNMYAVENASCAPKAMRHELGHNMGLQHYKDDIQAGQYHSGYREEKTPMAGNMAPVFSTPRVLSYETGQPFGIEDEVDGVRAMNEFAPTVAQYGENLPDPTQHSGEFYHDKNVEVSNCGHDHTYGH